MSFPRRAFIAQWAVVTLAAALLVSGIPAWAVTPTVPVDRLRVHVEPVAPPPGLLDRLAAVFLQLRLRAIGPALPKSGTRFRVTATAYSSTVAQTDLTPCITAAGTRVRQGVVATNFLPLGTRLNIGDEEFVVEDRMNARYNGKFIIDIWHPTTRLAREFGAQTLNIEVIGWVKPGTLKRPSPTPSPSPPAEPPPPFKRLLGFLFGRAFVPEEEDCL